MRKLLALAMLLFVAPHIAQASDWDRAALDLKQQLEWNLDDIREAVRPFDAAPLEKAVSRKDKSESVIIGAVGFDSGVQFLSDGTPIRIIGINVKSPVQQQVWTSCIGTANAIVHCALRIGQRVEFTNWVIPSATPGQAGLNLLIATKLKR